ncbi:MAG: RHS repeat-associated core domain-containing protein [Sulfuricaulis sp.]|nr:RHS repeat-associated core domain-containing protein [Sulfuricaulis sp.]
MDTSGAWKGDSDTRTSLTQDASGYTLTRAEGTTERYDLNGKLLSETDSSGRITVYGYDGSGRPTVTAPFGHTLTFGYNASNHVSTVTDPAGKVISYGYDANNNLTRVDYPDGTAKLYHYNEPNLTSGANLPNHLTGISYVDASNVTTRFSSYEYYYNSSNAADPNNGKAIRTEHAPTDNGVAQEKFTLAYDSDTQTTVTDPVNTQEVMTFSANLGVKNLTLKVNQSDGKSLQQKFDANNNLICRQDEENRVTLYGYNATNQRESLTEGLAGDCSNPPGSTSATPVTRTITYTYKEPTLDLPRFIRRPSVAAGKIFETEIQYNDAGHPHLQTDIIQRGFTPTNTAVSRTVTLGYNASGQVTSINGPRLSSEPGMNGLDDLTTLEYYTCTMGGACGQLKKLTNALGHVTTYDLYDLNGRVIQLTDPNGLVTVYEYDPRGKVRFIRQTPPGGGTRVTEYTYTPFGAVQTASLSGDLTPTLTLIYNYDAAQYLRSVMDNLGHQVTYHYDLKGNRDGEEARDPDGTLLVRTIAYASDLRNRLKTINTAGSITQLVFDAVGNLRTEVDPNNNPNTTHTPDALNRLVQTIDRMSGQTTYDYDVNDRLIQAKAPNNATTQYQYDDLGNLLKEISLDRGTSAYTYDNAGNVKTITDARGVLATYTHDALNRLTFLDYPGIDDDVTFRYDGPACSYGRGRLCQALTVGGNRSYGYDAYGNVVDLSYQINSVNYVVHYGYDAGNRIKTITYPSGLVITYIRDAVGRIQYITRTVGGVTTALVSDRRYRADGLPKQQTFGNTLPESRLYDLQGRLTSQTVGTVYNRLYPLHDNNGNVKQLVTSAFTGDYLYDPLDRLKQDAPSPGTAHDFDYDGNGNRTLDNAIPYIYLAASNRLSSIGGSGAEDTLTYDAAGNMKSGAFGRSYTYDGPGRLSTATAGSRTTTYRYNAFGQRTQKQRPNLPSVYYYTGLQGELLAETDGSGAPLVEYIYADQEPIAQLRYAPEPGSAITTPPTVSGFWPGSGAENTTVLVFGSGFNPTFGATTVKINGIPAPIMQVLSPDLLFFLLPAGNTNGPIQVTTAQGSATSASAFGTPLTGVQITGLWPAQGQVNTLAFVFGSGFVAGQTVKVNQTPAPIVQVLDSSLFFVMVPPGATTGPITVTTPQGSATSAASFTVFGTSVPASTTVTYLHADHLGTPRAGTDQSGVVVWRWEGSACGDTLATGSATVNLRFAGQYYDRESQLHYNNARYFDPRTCRYISSDPIGLRGGMNTYTYGLNNPLRYIDPFGLETLGIGIEPPIASAIVNGVLNPAEDPGHTFLYLMNDKDQITNVLSVGPSSPIGALNKNSFLNGTLGAVSNWSITGQVSTYEWDITPKQYAQCQKTLNQMKKNPGNYSPTNQCTSAAISAAKQCGVNVPSGISSVQVPPIPLIFKGYSNNLPNPYGLQQQLNKTMTPKIVPDSTFTIQ